MNAIEMLRADLERQFPGVRLEIDAPADVLGIWYLDVRSCEAPHWIVVEWRPNHGFGVSTPTEADYGTKPDELSPDLPTACARVARLLATGQPTRSPRLSNSPT